VSLCKAIAENNPNVKKVIYISSQAAAGPSTEGSPVTESDIPHPITTYGESKLAGEKAALSYTDKYHVVAVRPPGIYGPGDKEIFSFFQTVYRGIKPHFGDINRRLQLVHVDDLAYGVFLALTRQTESGHAYFIAEDRSYSMAELIGILQQACGRKAIALPIPGMLFRGVAALSEFGGKMIGRTPMLTREKARELLASWEISTKKAKQAFGFEARISFEQGAKETFEWYLRQGWLK
jgi:nucleoside-diphosphate-sugar epimerase